MICEPRDARVLSYPAGHVAHARGSQSDGGDQLAQSDARGTLNDGEGPHQPATAKALRACPARHREREEEEDRLPMAGEQNLHTKRLTKYPKNSSSEFSEQERWHSEIRII